MIFIITSLTIPCNLTPSPSTLFFRWYSTCYLICFFEHWYSIGPSPKTFRSGQAVLYCSRKVCELVNPPPKQNLNLSMHITKKTCLSIVLETSSLLAHVRLRISTLPGPRLVSVSCIGMPLKMIRDSIFLKTNCSYCWTVILPDLSIKKLRYLIKTVWF